MPVSSVWGMCALSFIVSAAGYGQRFQYLPLYNISRSICCSDGSHPLLPVGTADHPLAAFEGLGADDPDRRAHHTPVKTRNADDGRSPGA